MTTDPTLPTSVPVFKRVLFWSAIVALAVAIIGGGIGYFAAGWAGVVSALIAAVMTLVFAGITVLTLILAAQLDTMWFFALILGSWLLKFVLFIGTLALIKDADFIHTWTLWGTIVAATIGTLAVDVVCVVTARLSYVSDAQLPDDKSDTPTTP